MDKLYTIQEVAAKLGLSDKTLRRWEEAGRFQSTRTLGNQRRYTIEDLQILDAIKHGTINLQSDLLTPTQAAALCGVSPATIQRWENEGKIHPFITSLNTFYPRPKLMEKLDELKKSSVEPPLTPEPEIPTLHETTQPMLQGTHLNRNPRLPVEEGSSADERRVPIGPLTPIASFSPILTNALVTLVLILSYHFFFNASSTPISPKPSTPPAQGSVQGVQAPDPRLDLLEKKIQDHLAAEILKDAKPLPTTTINLDNTALITGTASIPKGQDRLALTSDNVTATTPITITFTSDFSPAKKYWVTTNPGSFTLHTDFPVGADASFHYSFLAPASTPTPSSTPSAVLR